MQMWTTLTIVATIFAVAASSAAFAQLDTAAVVPHGDESANYQVEIVSDKLNAPVGITIRSGPISTGPHDLLIAEHGSGQIVRMATGQPEKVYPVITGLSAPTVGATLQATDLLGLTLLTRNKLVVGKHNTDAKQCGISVYALPLDGKPLTAEQADHTVDLRSAEKLSAANDSHFLGLTKTDDSLFAVTKDIGEGGGIYKSDIVANRLSFLQRLVPSDRAAVHMGSPTCITVTPKDRPRFLVVGFTRAQDTARDSSIAFLVPATGAMAMSLAPGLHEISSLAYSTTGNLFAANFSGGEGKASGIYRIDDARFEGKQACRAVKIASVDRPTGMAFTPEGALYVTALGKAEDDSPGLLIKITGPF